MIPYHSNPNNHYTPNKFYYLDLFQITKNIRNNLLSIWKFVLLLLLLCSRYYAMKDVQVLLNKINNMKKYFAIIILVVLSQFLFAQEWLELEFENYTPKWSHVAIDSTRMPDDNNIAGHVHFPKFIVKNNIIYGVYFIPLYEGGFIEAIDTDTGASLWSDKHDLTTQDRREYTNSIFFDAEGNLELLGFRKYKNKVTGVERKFSRRLYDADDGTLIEHVYAENEDTLSPIVISNEFFIPEFFRDIDSDNYQFLSGDHRNWGKVDSISACSFIFDKNGHIIDKSYKSFGDPDLPSYIIPYIVGEAMDSIYLILADVSDDFDYDTYYILDRQLNVLSKKEETTSRNDPIFKGVSSKRVDNHNFIYEWDIHNSFKRFYLIDIFRNRIDSCDIPFPENKKFLFTQMTKLNDGSYLIVLNTYNRIKGMQNSISFYRWRIGEEVELLRTINHKLPNHYMQGDEVFEMPNGDILFCGKHHFVTFKSNGSIAKTHNGGWYQWICFPAADIGLTTDVADLETNLDDLFVIYPNPTQNGLNIKLKKSISGIVQISNKKGEMILEVELNNSLEKNVDISKLPPSIYTVNIISKDIKSKPKKFVKID